MALVESEAITKELRDTFCSGCNVFWTHVCSEKRCRVAKTLHIIRNAPTEDAVPIPVLEKWLFEVASNNFDNSLGNACEELTNRLDGLRQFAKEMDCGKNNQATH